MIAHNKKLIIHVGPPKCGSTSIQTLLRRRKIYGLDNVYFMHFLPQKYSEFYKSEIDNSSIQFLAKLLEDRFSEFDCIVISHESLFQFPHVIRNLCYAVTDLNPEILVLGYARRQSSFISSLYSQWLFRSPSRIKEVSTILDENGYNSFYFSGLERHFIASIIDDFYSSRMLSGHIIHDWYKSYSFLQESLKEFSAVVNCSLLPGKSHVVSLEKDFCDLAELNLTEERFEKNTNIDNRSFSPDLIEAVNISAFLGHKVPGPHVGNKVLNEISKRIESMDEPVNEFINEMMSYVDSYYMPSNNSFCESFDLNKKYFHEDSRYTKNKILNFAHLEQERRLNDSSYLENKYRLMLSSITQACLRLANSLQNS